MTTLGTRIFTLLKGRYMGKDQFGNRYYEERGVVKNRRRKRWVIYRGIAEASKVPAEWHGWLHYTLKTPLSSKRYAWQQPHLPNLTGTLGRYLPKGHLLKGGKRAANKADYQAWTPDA